MFLYQFSVGVIKFIATKLARKKLERDIKSGKIKMISLDDLIPKNDDNGGPTWN